MLGKALQKAGAFRLASRLLHSKASRALIPYYIKKNAIDMRPYAGQTYGSFAVFFARKRQEIRYAPEAAALISPCDGLLSVYRVTPDLTVPMKGSVYALADLLPDQKTVRRFGDGLCLVFRLEAADYHHFCCFDDGRLVETHFIPGQLHSVQPIACRQVPVFRLNRRWWSILETKNFGTAAQIEIGAMLVGGVSFALQGAAFHRGDDMGNFELAGSTIVLLLDSAVRRRLALLEPFMPALDGEKEVRVRIGAAIGMVKDEE
ncbi:MAG: phosphatidylserine decarboxylase [Firmicutes bacterium]|nr:phosphatidylserine decarboxylase [Bacillota bacterium]